MDLSSGTIPLHRGALLTLSLMSLLSEDFKTYSFQKDLSAKALDLATTSAPCNTALPDNFKEFSKEWIRDKIKGQNSETIKDLICFKKLQDQLELSEN